MSYGLEQFDSSGNLVMDTSSPVTTLVKVDTVTFTLVPTSAGGSTANYNLPGVTSSQDLEDNYIIQEIGSGGFSLAGSRGSFTITYVSPGVVNFANNNSCRDINGNIRQCTTNDVRQETFNIYAMGKTL
jgi:hypothetical protein